MEQAGLPSYAEGRSVSPEQMRVELMINGHKVHQEDLPHDHPLIQHLAGGGSATAQNEGILSKIGRYFEKLPEEVRHPINAIRKDNAVNNLFRAIGVTEAGSIPDDLKRGDYLDAATHALDTAGGFVPQWASKAFPLAQAAQATKDYLSGDKLSGNLGFINAGASMLAPHMTIPINAAIGATQHFVNHPEDVPSATSDAIFIPYPSIR